MSLPVVFVSYSHKDEAETVRLCEYLEQFRGIEFELWSDKQIGPGDSWEQKIESSIEKAAVAVLVLSVDFLHSKFIEEFELPKIFDRYDRGELKIYPLVLKECEWAENERLRRLQVRPEGGAPVHPWANEARALNPVAREVARMIRGAAEPPMPAVVRRRWRVLAFSVLVVAVWAFAVRVTSPRSLPRIQVPPFSVLVRAPAYLTPDAEEVLSFTINNEDSVRSHAYEFHLKDDGSVPYYYGTGGSNLIRSGMLAAGLKETHDLKVLCSWPADKSYFSLGVSAGLSLAGQVEGTSFEKKQLPIKIAPLPRAVRFFSNWGLLALAAYFVIAWIPKAFPAKRTAS